MAQLNSGIILQGAQPNILAAMDAGQQAGARQNAIQQQNALAQAYKTDGAGIIAGDQGALNRLAAIDAPLAMDFRTSQQTMQRLSREEAWAIEDRAKALSAEERAAAADRQRQIVAQGLAIPDSATWDAFVTEQGAPELVGKFDQRQMFANRYLEMADIIANMAAPDPVAGAPSGQMWINPRDKTQGVTDLPGARDNEAPMTTIGKINADLEAGRITPEDAQLELERATPRGMVIESLPGGGFRFTEKASSGGRNGDVNVGDAYNPGEVMSTIALIDEIMADPALPRVVGPLVGGGGNDVDQLNFAQRAIYGAQGLNVIEKVNQLQSRTWLAARDMLKGGGPITDYESRKAEAAVARLSRAKGDEEYMAALQDLRDAITEGMAKLESAGSSQASQAQAAPLANGGAADVRPRLGTVQDGYRYLGGNPANPASWEQVQ